MRRKNPPIGSIVSYPLERFSLVFHSDKWACVGGEWFDDNTDFYACATKREARNGKAKGECIARILKISSRTITVQIVT